MIDTHLHLGQLVLEDPGLTPGKLLRWMDRHGIEKGIVMAVEVPEELDFYLTTKELLKLTRPHRDRLLPLCAVDPRHRYPGRFNPYPILEHYMDQGCVGYGENLCGLPVDDPMQQRVYEACDRLGLAIVMHIDHWINRDEPGLPGFERMLKTYRNVKWVGHAQYFWREISAEIGEGRALSGGAGDARRAPGYIVSELLESVCRPLGAIGLQRHHTGPRIRAEVPEAMEASVDVRHGHHPHAAVAGVFDCGHAADAGLYPGSRSLKRCT